MQYLEVPLTPWDQCSRTYGQTGALESPKSVGKLIQIFIFFDVTNINHFYFLLILKKVNGCALEAKDVMHAKASVVHR